MVTPLSLVQSAAWSVVMAHLRKTWRIRRSLILVMNVQRWVLLAGTALNNRAWIMRFASNVSLDVNVDGRGGIGLSNCLSGLIRCCYTRNLSRIELLFFFAEVARVLGSKVTERL